MSQKFIFVNTDGENEESAGAYEETDFINTSAGAADAGKPIVLNASGLIDSSMVDASSISHDGTTGAAASTVHTAFSMLDGTRDYTAIVGYSSHPTFVADTDIVDKKYVDDIAIASEWYPDSALSYVADNTVAPATEVSGDVYVLSATGGSPHVDYDGASAGDIVKFDGTVWVATTPTTGTKVTVDDEPNTAYYIWGGSAWSQKLLEATTASTGLVKVGQDIRIDASAGGDGLGFAAGVLSVNVDDSSIETSADTLQVKALGITDAMLAGSISDGKLAQDYIQTSEVDGTSIEFSGGSLNVLVDGIDDSHIDFGLGANQVSAADLPIADAGAYTDATEVESALQELYSLNEERGIEMTAGTGGVTKGDLLFISANDTASIYGTLSTREKAIGLANATIGAGSAVRSLANDTVIEGVLSGATAGTVYYWDGSSLVSSLHGNSAQYEVQCGIAKNATDLYIEIKTIKKNS